MTNLLDVCIDGDLLALIEKILAEQGPDSAQVSKVKGHADESMVRDGRVRMLDKIGNDLADRAADFGRRRVPPTIIDSKRMVHSACTACDSLVPDSHRFFLAIATEAVNRDGRGGTSNHPTVWSAAGVPPWALGCWYSWHAAVDDLGVGGVSCIWPLIMCEKWAFSTTSRTLHFSVCCFLQDRALKFGVHVGFLVQ